MLGGFVFVVIGSGTFWVVDLAGWLGLGEGVACIWSLGRGVWLGEYSG